MMIQKNTLKFLDNLQLNNEKAWFEANRNRYEDAKQDFYALVERMISNIGNFDADIAPLQVKNCVFRQYRDVRFAKDKRPYKNNMGAYFNKGGKKINTAGYYLHLEPGKSFYAGGLYEPEAPLLAQVRQEIDYNLAVFQKMINKQGFKKYFPAGMNASNKLVRPPRGYDADNPAIEFLKLKNFTVSTPITDEELFSSGIEKKCLSAFRELKPLLDFLNQPI